MTKVSIQIYDSGSYDSWSEARGSGAIYEEEIEISSTSSTDIINIATNVVNVTCKCIGCSSINARIQTIITEDLFIAF